MGCTTSKHQGQSYDIRVKKKSKQSTGETKCQNDWPQFKQGSGNDCVLSEQFSHKTSNEDKKIDYEAKDFQILQQIINEYSRKNSIEDQDGFQNNLQQNTNRKLEVQIGDTILVNDQNSAYQNQQQQTQNSEFNINRSLISIGNSTQNQQESKQDDEEDDFFPIFEDDDNISINYQHQKYQFQNKKKQVDKKNIVEPNLKIDDQNMKYFSQQFHKRHRSTNLNFNKNINLGLTDSKIKVIQMKVLNQKNYENMCKSQNVKDVLNYDHKEQNQLQSLGEIIPKYRVSYKYLSQQKQLKNQNYLATPMLQQKIDQSFLIIKRKIHNNCKQLKQKQNQIIKYNKSCSSNEHQMKAYINETAINKKSFKIVQNKQLKKLYNLK